MTGPYTPRAGDVVQVSRRSLIGGGLIVRVISKDTLGSTPDGWIWLDGYVLDVTGNAVERRRLFVQLAHLRDGQVLRHGPACTCPRVDVRIPHRMECPRHTLNFRDGRLGSIRDRARRNAGPVTVPRQRTTTENTGRPR